MCHVTRTRQLHTSPDQLCHCHSSVAGNDDSKLYTKPLDFVVQYRPFVLIRQVQLLRHAFFASCLLGHIIRAGYQQLQTALPT